MPLTATIAPAAQRRAARLPRARVAGDGLAGRAAARSRGPQSGHAFGCAWKRRSRGSSYSAGSARTSRSRPSWSAAGRRARRVDDREPRPAVGAVDERVADSGGRPGRSSSAQALVAGGGVGRDERVRRARPSRSDDRGSRARRSARAASRRRRSTAASGGASAARRVEEAVDRRAVALDLEQHAARVVEHEPAEPELARRAGRRTAGSRRPAPSRDPARTPPAQHAPGASRGTAAPSRQLDQLAQHVVGARLRLLDPRDVLASG